MTIKYTFIHPTKCGGTSCDIYFKKHYSDYIVGGDHSILCGNNNNPIIIVRDVKSRFLSMFKYWKSGAIDTHYKRDEQFINKYKEMTILDFISLLKNKDYSKLHVGFTWSSHFTPNSHWINNTDYKNIIILKYNHNLNDSIHKLINILNIPNKNVILPITNISKTIDKDIEIYEQNKDYINNFINEYFKDDVDLMNTINNFPEKFKFVI